MVNASLDQDSMNINLISLLKKEVMISEKSNGPKIFLIECQAQAPTNMKMQSLNMVQKWNQAMDLAQDLR